MARATRSIEQLSELGLELLDRPRRGRRVDELLLDLLQLLAAEFVQLVDRSNASSMSSAPIASPSGVVGTAVRLASSSCCRASSRRARRSSER